MNASLAELTLSSLDLAMDDFAPSCGQGKVRAVQKQPKHQASILMKASSVPAVPSLNLSFTLGVAFRVMTALEGL